MRNIRNLDVPSTRWGTYSDLVASLVTILAIGSIFASFLIPETFLDSHHLHVETMGLLIAVIFLIFGDRFIDIVRHKETTKAISELVDPMWHVLNCTYIGTYEEALEYVRGKTKFAECVKDTIISYGINKAELDIYFYDIEGAKTAQTMFSDLAKRGKLYRAVISRDEGVPEMFAEDRKLPNFHVKVLNKSHPSINFTIIEYGPGDENREVLFGWGHHVHDERGHVFSSRNWRLVDTFDKLFQTLSQDTTDLDEFLKSKEADAATGAAKAEGDKQQKGGVDPSSPPAERGSPEPIAGGKSTRTSQNPDPARS